MNKKQTILIGGQPYDAITGLPVAKSATPSPASSPAPISVPKPSPSAQRITVAHSATKIHATTQRSVALNRKFVGKPKTLRTDITTTHRIKPVTSQAVHTQTHPQVRRFAPHPIAVKTHKSNDIAPIAHPHVTKAHALSAQKASARPAGSLAAHIPSKHVKQQAITHAVANTHTSSKEVKTHFWQKQRASSIIAATFALVLLGGYFTYLNMPSLSVRVAAAQAGIDASYPDYRPDGYALNGPVTYADGRVSMNFKANASDAKFSVNQSESGWDSSAVLDNYVLPRSGNSYMPFTERGLTIYTFNNNAAWVNGGILYTIDGDAPLSNEQIRRIATSLL